MELKDIYEKIETTEGGGELVAALKNVVGTLNAEAKKHREQAAAAGEKLAALTGQKKALLESLGLEDTEEAAAKAKELKEALDSFSAGGKKPDEVLKEVTLLKSDLDRISKELEAEKEAKAAETSRRIEALKSSSLVSALTRANAAAPGEVAKILASEVQVGENDSLTIRHGDESLELEAGVNAWLEANPWAVRAGGKAGAGSSGTAGSEDSFTAGFDEN